MDTLATTLHVKTDDLLKESPQLAPYRPKIGIGRSWPMLNWSPWP
jgi:hypothetical protein